MNVKLFSHLNREKYIQHLGFNWVAMLCSPVSAYKRFGGVHRLCLQS
jgi:hypothetical protein